MRNPAKPGHTRSPRLTLGVAVAAASLAMTACSGSSSSGAAAPSGSPAGSSSDVVLTTPKASGPIDTLDWDLPYGEPITLDYVKAADYGPDMVVSNLCDSLLRLEPDYSSSPSLATSWKTSSDHLTTTFTLRTDVKFWDGHPMTPEDVAYSLLRNMDPKNEPVNGAFFDHVKSIVPKGNDQVVVTFSKPDELFIKEMATVAGQVSEKAYTESKGAKYGSAEGGVMCSGPFKLENGAWKPGQDITLTANTDYWNPDLRPLASKVVLHFISDSSTLAQAIASGEVQGAYELPPAILPAVSQSGTGNVYQGKSLQVYELGPNAPGPMEDQKLRQALGMVIDRTALAQVVFHGAADPNYTLIPPPAWDPTGLDIYQKAYDQIPHPDGKDIDAAKQLIAGDPNASKTIVLAIGAGNQTGVDTATLIQQEAAQIGLKIQIKQMQPLEFSTAFFDANARKGVDLMLTQGWVDVPDPLDYLGLIVLPDSYFNWLGLKNETVASLVDKARSNYDDKQRATQITQAQASYEPTQPEIPMLALHELLYMNKDITGAPASFAYIFEPSLATVGSAS
jgi:peptide/nickel transport system substrate-binding protein